jgi:hypothetical protein
MAEESEDSRKISPDLTKIVLNTLYLCLARAVDHIARASGPQAASRFKIDLLEELRNGSIDMALLEDAATYDFVVEKIENIPIAVPEGQPSIS